MSKCKYHGGQFEDAISWLTTFTHELRILPHQAELCINSGDAQCQMHLDRCSLPNVADWNQPCQIQRAGYGRRIVQLMIRDKLGWESDHLTGAQRSQSNESKNGHVSLRFYGAGLRQAS